MAAALKDQPRAGTVDSSGCGKVLLAQASVSVPIRRIIGPAQMGLERSISVTGKLPSVRKPSGMTLLLAAIPFLALCFSVPLWDRLHPMLFGLPFNLAWLSIWIVLSSLCMWLAQRIEASRERGDKPP